MADTDESIEVDIVANISSEPAATATPPSENTPVDTDNDTPVATETPPTELAGLNIGAAPVVGGIAIGGGLLFPSCIGHTFHHHELEAAVGL